MQLKFIILNNIFILNILLLFTFDINFNSQWLYPQRYFLGGLDFKVKLMAIIKSRPK